MKFTEVAVKVLQEAGHPLHYKEITERAIKNGILITKGLTPALTMVSCLGTDIRKNEGNSLFVREDKAGEFGLKNYGTLPGAAQEAKDKVVSSAIIKGIQKRGGKKDDTKS